LVPPNDAEKTAKAMVELAKNEKLRKRMGRQGRIAGGRI